MGRKTTEKQQRLRGIAAVTAIYLFGALPLLVNRALGVFIGWMLLLFGSDNKRTARINLDLCFPQKSEQEKRKLLRDTMRETGKGTLEVAYVWRQPKRALKRIKRIQGLELLEQARQSQQAVIILAPHHGCWELLNYWVSHHYPFHVLFNPSGLDAVDKLIARSRETFNTTTHPATKRGVAGLIRALKKGNMTGILPDQVPDRSNTHFAPFFNRSAATASLACRLIQQTQAVALCCFVKRLPSLQGYELIIRAADKAIYHDDLSISLAAMNRSIESLILEAPSQYLWSYKRFRRRPKGIPNPYSATH